MPVDHYENFPVGSLLLPARLRRPVAAVYWFARQADDFADEGERSPGERLSLLEGFRAELRAIEAGRPAGTPFFAELSSVVRDHTLPLQPFHDLLDAFSQDVVKKRYADFAEVLDYCRRSANPVGRLMLCLYGAAGEARHLEWSDAICSSLQLINFWQDVEVDYAKDRIYLPQDDMARFGVPETQIAARDTAGGWRALMRFEIARAREMMLAGAPLAKRLPGRIGLELRTIVQGGLRIAEKLERVEGDVFRRRPVLHAWDWPLMLGRALAM
jgi:squalene synthase HpnC